MNVVVVGGAGQLGGLVLARLAGVRKVRRVIALDRTGPLFRSAKIESRQTVPGDPGIERHFEGADAVISTAPVDAPDECGPARRLLEGVMRATVPNLIVISSLGSEPDGDLERTMAAFSDELGPRRVWLRLGVLVGRRMPGGVSAFERFGDGPLPLIWDEDAADAVMRALLGEARGTFTLVADRPLTARALFGDARVRALFARDLDARWAALRARASRRVHPGRLAPDLELDSDRARRVLDWAPRAQTSDEVLARAAEIVPRRADPRIVLFLRIVDTLGRHARIEDLPAEARRMNLTLHLDLTGPRGGDWVMELREGRARVRRGIARPPDGTITLSADTLLRLLSGAEDFSRARMAARVRSSGEPNAALVFAGMIQSFRNALARPGAAGLVTKGLARWFSAGDGRTDK
jgi:nucleoside-diphosphate-sugar epimerase